MTKRENIFTNILNINTPLTVNGVEDATGVRLTLNPDAHNTFDVYEGICTNIECDFSSAEFRHPPKGSSVEDGILILSVNTNKHVFTKKDIIEEFGNPELSPPNPRQRNTPLIYLKYSYNGGKINFGFPFEKNRKEELQKIVLDYTGK